MPLAGVGRPRLAGRAGRGVRRRAAEPRRRSGASPRAHRVHGAVQHVRPPRDQRPVDHDLDGRPIGVQLVGRRFADLVVLRVAAACEALRPALAAMARRTGALTAPDIDADRGALTVRPLRLPPREGFGRSAQRPGGDASRLSHATQRRAQMRPIDRTLLLPCKRSCPASLDGRSQRTSRKSPIRRPARACFL